MRQAKQSVRSGSIRLVAGLMAAGWAGAAWAQEAGEGSLVSMPPDLAEHEPGARERPEAVRADDAAEKPAAEAQVAEAGSTEGREWFGPAPEFLPWWKWGRVTGDWAGARTWLEDHGVTVGASYTLDWQSVWEGGRRNVASTRTGFDLNATLDLEKAVGLKGGSVFVDFLSTDPRGGSRDVGDYGGVSNVETGANVDQVAELWYQQWLWEDRVRVKVGKIDAQGEFALPRVVESFVGSPPVTNNTLLQAMPTWPNPATAAVVFVYPIEHVYAGAGFFDGSTSAGKNTGRLGPKPLFKGDEYYWIGEAGLTWKQVGALGLGRVGLGGWHHTGEFGRFDGGVEDGTSGFFVLGEQQVWVRGDQAEDAEMMDAGAAKGLFVLAHAGWADEAVNLAGFTGGVGLTLRGTCAARPEDGAGVFVSFTDITDDAAAGLTEDETSVEVYYRVQVTPAVATILDVQFIDSPGGDATIDDAVVGGLRVEIVF